MAVELGWLPVDPVAREHLEDVDRLVDNSAEVEVPLPQTQSVPNTVVGDRG
ncbi:MAG: hypothetical protein ABI873_12560 [Marmoricola sp.]